MSILDYYTKKDLPPPVESDRNFLKTRKVKGLEYLFHPKLGCYWDAAHNSWVSYPRSTAISSSCASYIHYESPEITRAIKEYISDTNTRDTICLAEQLDMIVSIIFVFSCRRDSDKDTDPENQRFSFALSQTILQKLSSHGPDFIKHLMCRGLLGCEQRNYKCDLWNTFYFWTGNYHMSDIRKELFRYTKNADKYEHFTQTIRGQEQTAPRRKPCCIENKHTAEFSFKIDHVPVGRFTELELKRMQKKGCPENISPEELKNMADSNAYSAIGKMKAWNNLDYKGRLEAINFDEYAGRMYSPFTNVLKWCRKFASHDNEKQLLVSVDMQTAQYQILVNALGLTTGKLYEDVFHGDYYSALASRILKEEGVLISRKEAQVRALVQIFWTLTNEYTKAFLKAYPEAKKPFLELKKAMRNRIDGEPAKDALHHLVTEIEVAGMRGVIERLDKLGCSCIKVHDELIIFFDPQRHHGYTEKQTQRYYTKVIVSAFRESFGFKETQLHFQFKDSPEIDVACWNLDGKDNIVMMNGERYPLELYALDNDDGGDWRNRLMACQAAARKYGQEWRRAVFG